MTMDRANIIALLGIDGAGKTTQARQLTAWLAELGVSASYHRNEAGRGDLDELARCHGRRDIGDLLGRDIASYPRLSCDGRAFVPLRMR
jgi:dTMP kinase